MTDGYLTQDDARRLFLEAIERLGSKDALAKAAGCSPSRVSQVYFLGKPLGPKLCKALGLEQERIVTVRYRVIEAGACVEDREAGA